MVSPTNSKTFSMLKVYKAKMQVKEFCLFQKEFENSYKPTQTKKSSL